MDKNIILIGMPGSGKSTVGKIIAEKLNMKFVDLDTEIENYVGIKIPDIFAKKGEKFFRDAETHCAKVVAKMTSAVVATGGGILLKEENMKALSENGVVIFLDRPVKEILGEDLSGRPLLKDDSERIYKLYNNRIDLYKKYGEYKIESIKSPEYVAKEVVSALSKKNYRLGVIGNPIAHTLSPMIHTKLAEFLGVSCEYIPYKVEDVREFVAFAKKESLDGFNITIPHKKAIFDELTECDDYAKICGAVNTVKLTDGVLKGYNTDGDGIFFSLMQNGVNPENKRVMLIGAGGAAVSICQKMLSVGALVTVLCRDVSKFCIKGAEVVVMTQENLKVAAEKSDIIVNATPLGMEGIADDFTDFSFLDSTSAFVYDIVYKPYETNLVRESKKRGLMAENGLSMLINQAIYAFAVFTNRQFDFNKASEYLQKEMQKEIYK